MSMFKKLFGKSKKLDELERSVNDLKKVCLTEISEINEKIEDLRKTLCEIALQIVRISSRLSCQDYEALISIARDAIQVKREQQISESAKHVEDWRKTVRTLSEPEKDTMILRLLSMVEGDAGYEWKDDVAKIRNDLRKKYGIPTKSVETETNPVEDKAGPVAEEKKDKPVSRAKRRFKKTVKKASKKAKPENKAVSETEFVTAMNAGPNEGTVG